MFKNLCERCATKLGYSESDINSKHFHHSGFCEECLGNEVEIAMFDGFDAMDIQKVKLKEGVGVDIGDKVNVDMIDKVVGEDKVVNFEGDDGLVRKLFEQIEGDAERLHTANGVIEVLVANAKAMNSMVELLSEAKAQKSSGCGGKCGGRK